ncbi:hypothetical protein NIES4072_02070 [Nostoc commune NIES-4072]|uniref:Uncharacterized protein n=1 Tax=Nostoc commune NIES-4072 TaxID=2005467 RepID=A0A2R5FL95_NOSCO|nr:hypothetical protein NIES4070_24750 [Nostoc commune HK-02]GBG16561.1 hypothetical protein NIES4072_02070 [Nostoc commune NIES-4072]
MEGDKGVGSEGDGGAEGTWGQGDKSLELPTSLSPCFQFSLSPSPLSHAQCPMPKFNT